MKIVWLLSLTVSSVISLPESSQDVKEQQSEILKLYQGLGTEDSHDFVKKGFPFVDTKYFKESNVVDRFVEAYDEGFIDKEGYFTLYSYKNRHDTRRLFDLFYFAKDFDTFIKIAKWAKHELNPLQFVHALTAAIYHRKDTVGVMPPPFYEVLPSYYIPSDVMLGAYKAMIQDIKYSKFDVNGTGYFYSWYKGQTLDSDKFGPKYNEYDVESRLSYFREDVDVNDWLSKFFLHMCPWLNEEKYKDLQLERKGEYMYLHFKWFLGRYNMERFANGLPPVEPIDFKTPLKTGYNSHLSDIQGRPILNRPDYFDPYISNREGVDHYDNMYNRYLRDIDSNTFFNPLNQSFVSLEGVEGFELLTRLVFGISHPAIRKLYGPIYFQGLNTLDASVKSSNDIMYTGSPIGNYLTEMRDPAYFGILAHIYKLFIAYDSNKKPYTKEEIDFPGVIIKSMDFSKFETYFERYDFDISNGIPYKGDTGKYKYIVSKHRLNHKPYSIKLTVHSDKEVDAFVKIFLAPKFDTNYRQFGFNGFVKHAVPLDMVQVILKPGTNTVELKSTNDIFMRERPRLKNIIEKLQQAKQTGSPFFYSVEEINAFPRNLALPRGSQEGNWVQVMAIVFPSPSSTENSDVREHSVLRYEPQAFYFYPFDRRSRESSFQTGNVYFSEFAIYDHSKYF